MQLIPRLTRGGKWTWGRGRSWRCRHQPCHLHCRMVTPQRTSPAMSPILFDFRHRLSDCISYQPTGQLELAEVIIVISLPILIGGGYSGDDVTPQVCMIRLCYYVCKSYFSISFDQCNADFSNLLHATMLVSRPVTFAHFRHPKTLVLSCLFNAYIRSILNLQPFQLLPSFHSDFFPFLCPSSFCLYVYT